jgi:hypothetical protein
MIYRFVDFINTWLQPGVKKKAGCEPLQRLLIRRKTVETVLRSVGWLHLAEARC